MYLLFYEMGKFYFHWIFWTILHKFPSEILSFAKRDHFRHTTPHRVLSIYQCPLWPLPLSLAPTELLVAAIENPSSNYQWLQYRNYTTVKTSYAGGPGCKSWPAPSRTTLMRVVLQGAGCSPSFNSQLPIRLPFEFRIRNFSHWKKYEWPKTTRRYTHSA